MLFGKLQQGVQENDQILTVARMRADAEDLYGNKLGDIEASTNRIGGGFQRDDGASVKKVRKVLAGARLRTMLTGTGVRRRADRDE